MAEKRQAAPPIDRPLSKSFVREFLGWSTAFGPGLAEAASLRQMENVLLGRDGSARVRPALRLMQDAHLSTGDFRIVGSFEQHIGSAGDKELLFAVLDVAENVIRFWTAIYDGEVFTNLEQVADSPEWSPENTYVKYLQINNRIYCLGNGGVDAVAVYDTGSWEFLSITGYPGRPTVPTAALGGALTTGDYNYAFFCTRTNEFGESMPSELVHLTANEKWTGWAPGDKITVSGLPGTGTWNLYFLEWSKDANVPIEGIQIVENGTGTSLVVTTAVMMASSSAPSHFLPSPADMDSSSPPIAAQGLVAADRLILVNDFENRARIRWSSNMPGLYGNFNMAQGGGYKTLSSGNLQIPYTVVLWQNPQSVDTLTILCAGIDGYHACYYMSPGSVTGQVEEDLIMGFEETTATPGTVSPYGCEVFNKALYHPLDDQLMKSTANNYNINHKNMSEAIANQWQQLRNKRNIVSSQLDGRLYYIVDNPAGEDVPPGCMGNEIWVADMGAGEGTRWSRLMIPAVSLRRIESNGRLHMGVVRPEGIYRLDELEYIDQLPGGDKAIDWFLQTNTQGANGARDSWVHLQQVGLILGNLYGKFRYGVQSWSQNGKPITEEKVYRQPNEVDRGPTALPFDHEDLLQVKQGLQQWFFSAGSVRDPETGEVLPSYGQISSINYRFTPISVNIGYELGSNQTYEYAHADAVWARRTAINGIPIPSLDPRRP